MNEQKNKNKKYNYIGIQRYFKTIKYNSKEDIIDYCKENYYKSNAYDIYKEWKLTDGECIKLILENAKFKYDIFTTLLNELISYTKSIWTLLGYIEGYEKITDLDLDLKTTLKSFDIKFTFIQGNIKVSVEDKLKIMKVVKDNMLYIKKMINQLKDFSWLIIVDRNKSTYIDKIDNLRKKIGLSTTDTTDSNQYNKKILKK